jgi:hypothetical protein
MMAYVQVGTGTGVRGDRAAGRWEHWDTPDAERNDGERRQRERAAFHRWEAQSESWHTEHGEDRAE